jgi:hypothetical protein
MNEELITVKEAAILMRRSHQSVRDLMNLRLLGHIRDGKLFTSHGFIAEYLAGKTVKPRPEKLDICPTEQGIYKNTTALRRAIPTRVKPSTGPVRSSHQTDDAVIAWAQRVLSTPARRSLDTPSDKPKKQPPEGGEGAGAPPSTSGAGVQRNSPKKPRRQ